MGSRPQFLEKLREVGFLLLHLFFGHYPNRVSRRTLGQEVDEVLIQGNTLVPCLYRELMMQALR